MAVSIEQRALDIDQWTFSRSIIKLERAIGMPIFERSRAGVTVTLAGIALIHGAKPIVATADKFGRYDARGGPGPRWRSAARA